MTIKLFDKGTYKLKSTGEVVTIFQTPDKHFWYWESFEEQRYKDCTEEDFTKQVYIGRGGLDELEIGDLVVYLTGGYNSAPSMSIGQVVGFKNTRVIVKLCQCGTSNIAPNNLLVITEKKLRDKYNWIE